MHFAGGEVDRDPLCCEGCCAGAVNLTHGQREPDRRMPIHAAAVRPRKDSDGERVLPAYIT